MLLEVCVDSLASARAAIAGGADRLELCSALLAGGLTPYTELLRQIRHESDVAVRCLMRPRAGDFLYMPEEIEMMCAQITELRSAGANGFVIGCLNPDGTLAPQPHGWQRPPMVLGSPYTAPLMYLPTHCKPTATPPPLELIPC